MDPWRWVDPRVREVKLADLFAYLERRGFVRKPGPNPHLVRFERPTCDLPTADDAPDRVTAITHFLTLLSEADGRHPVALLEEILAEAKPPPLRLLWVENHVTFARVAGRQFLAAYELTVVPTLAAAREALAAARFDAVLLDYDLDDGKGTSLFEVIAQLSPVPVVVATSAKDVGNEALLAAGARAACGKTKFAQIESVLLGALARSRAGFTA